MSDASDSSLGPEVEEFLQATKLEPGTVINRTYMIRQLIGAGSFGSVYEVYDLRLKRIVALKTVLTRFDSIQAQRLKREIELIRQIEHTNVVRLYDFGEDPSGILYMVMEFIEGKELGEVMREEGPFDLQRTLAISTQILDALVQAQKVGVVHRDLKPQNIILTREGMRSDVVKLVDFGIAKTYSDASVGPFGQMSSTMGFGTPLYMAPEQIQGTRVGPYTDVYTVGLIMLEMLTGAPPFHGETAIQILSEKTSWTPEIPRNIVPPPLAVVLEKAVQMDPKDRYQSARTMFLDLHGTGLLGPLSGVFEVPKDADPDFHRSGTAATVDIGDASTHPRIQAPEVRKTMQMGREELSSIRAAPEELADGVPLTSVLKRRKKKEEGHVRTLTPLKTRALPSDDDDL
ncbi:MAG: hypothetical protein AUK47_10380 [Deltaproteobacteria bacterium CG2_30_63_29]|nr:MAG: hypothetical protein AUK47_10380 [Deltaproteobacteria bacterium CG2_30_63_29]